MLPKPVPKKQKTVSAEPEKKDELILLYNLIQEKPWHAAITVAFIILCLFAGLMYRSQAQMRAQHSAAQLMAALEKTEPEEQVQALESLIESGTPLLAEALYRLGEAAYQAQDYARAKHAFERVRDEFPKSPFAPDAVEGLGFLFESQDPPDYESARAAYEKIMNDWPDSFAATRQFLNFGRCHERLGNYNDAIAAYRSQIAVAPNLSAATHAQEALNRLRLEKPELFAEEAAPAPAEPAAEETEAAEEDEVEAIEEPPQDIETEFSPDLKLRLPGGEVTPLSAPDDSVDVPFETHQLSIEPRTADTEAETSSSTDDKTSTE